MGNRIEKGRISWAIPDVHQIWRFVVTYDELFVFDKERAEGLCAVMGWKTVGLVFSKEEYNQLRRDAFDRLVYVKGEGWKDSG